MAETDVTTKFRQWLGSHSGGFHPDVKLHKDTITSDYGLSVFASAFLPPESQLVSCPVSLIISKNLAEKALIELLPNAAFQGWNERQFQITYMVLHSIITPTPKQLIHGPYLDILPASTTTSLYFTQSELECFKGSNLYAATLDRHKEWEDEWKACRSLIASVNQGWADHFTWELYLRSSTHITSRAFPSSLLPDSPETPYPVLIPGLDSFNHARDQEVSWIAATVDNPNVSIICHKVAVVGQELFIDYGPKPNAELILGYGFGLPDNPDDTILLKVGGGPVEGTTWQIGRDASGAEGLYEEILHLVSEEYLEGDISYEDHLNASDNLLSMVHTSLARLPDESVQNDPAVMRPEVFLMRKYYIQGQRDILDSLAKFAAQKEKETIEAAQAEGIELVIEDED